MSKSIITIVFGNLEEWKNLLEAPTLKNSKSTLLHTRKNVAKFSNHRHQEKFAMSHY